MSYEKAMKHSRNIRKVRKMVRGLQTTLLCTTHKPTEEELKAAREHHRKMQGK
jgi:hypothetical protein